MSVYEGTIDVSGRVVSNNFSEESNRILFSSLRNLFVETKNDNPSVSYTIISGPTTMGLTVNSWEVLPTNESSQNIQNNFHIKNLESVLDFIETHSSVSNLLSLVPDIINKYFGSIPNKSILSPLVEPDEVDIGTLFLLIPTTMDTESAMDKLELLDAELDTLGIDRKILETDIKLK